jgi:hypothetical protein
MKTITLKISDEIVKELESDMSIKHMTGNLFGLIDGIIITILKTLQDGDNEVTIKRK